MSILLVQKAMEETAMRNGVSYEEGNELIQRELSAFLKEGASEYEITKYVNKLDSKEQFENVMFSRWQSGLPQRNGNSGPRECRLEKCRLRTPVTCV